MPHHRSFARLVSSALAVAALLLSTVVFAGCAASAPAGEDAGAVGALPPAACRLAVGLPDYVAAPSGGLHFDQGGVALQEAVVNRLRALRSASDVIAVKDRAQARTEQADLYMELRVEGDVALAHAGLSGGWWSSGLLWMVTWIGGLLTDDSTYATSLRLRGDLASAQESRPPFASPAGDSGPVDLTYWDRNTLWSWRFLQCLVLPPFWTTDDPALTSAALSREATDRACVGLASFIKTQLEASCSGDLGGFELRQPENGASVTGDAVTLEFAIRARHGVINAVVLEYGDRVLPLTVPAPAEQAGVGSRGEFVCNVAPLLLEGLQPGANQIRIRADVGGLTLTRTVLVQRETRGTN